MSRAFAASLHCRLPALLFLFQGALLVVFVLFVTFDEHMDAVAQPAPSGPASNLLHATFSLFRDVQLMLLAGLGLLLAFMKGYGLSAVAFNFLLISVCTQWTLVVQGFTYHCHDGRIHLGLHNILTAEFAAVTVLISAGAILGRTSPVQLLPMGLCEIPLDMAVDVGGTLTLHVFACYFGLGTTIALHWPALQLGHPKETPPYSSDLLSLVGTTFLWAFWPGFVAVLIQPGHAQHRAVLHLDHSQRQRLALLCSLHQLGDFGPVTDSQPNLPHRVDVGIRWRKRDVVSCLEPFVGKRQDINRNIYIYIYILGILSSLACILGSKYMTPFLATNVHIQTNVAPTTFMACITGAVGGIMAILLIPDEAYGLHLHQVFPSRAPPPGNNVLEATSSILPGLILKLPCLAHK
uniref:Ammonium transporter AmtB-like domain-containing protein n=1 Tax=Varanus komodoensis TaxID=61221 RepID=A0A8D2IUW1_VARKO